MVRIRLCFVSEKLLRECVMKMLGLSLIIAVILCASTPVFAELSVEDLEKIRQIVNEVEIRLGKRT